jgi:predicted tellurium resistance membrane protein TerC
VLVKAKVTVVRFILIGIMVFTSFELITDGLARFDFISKVPGHISLTVFMIVMVIDALLLFIVQKKEAGRK